MHKINSDKFKVNKIIHFLSIIFFLSFIVMLLTFLNTRSVFDYIMFLSYFKSFELIMLNLIPIFLIMLFFCMLTNRTWFGFGITAYLFYILSLVNKFKLRFRDDPFIISDFGLVKEAGDMGGKYDISLSFKQIMVLVFILAIIILLKRYYKYPSFFIKTRISLSIIVSIIFVLTVRLFMLDSATYDLLGDKSLINIYSNSQQYQSKGFVYPFIYSSKYLKNEEPESYNKEDAEALLHTYVPENIPTNEKVDIIGIMLEAFNDLGKFEGVEFETDVYSKFNELQNESISGTIVTNVFAGGTVNTERAFLTGFQNQPDYRRRTNTFVDYFQRQGYFTDALHPSYGWFYNRRNVNENIGFQNFYYVENYFNEIVRDDVLFDVIKSQYENHAVDNQPYFNFTVTYQGHGPYSTEKLTDVNYLKWQESYNEADYNNINNYLSLIADTVNQIDNLVSYFRGRDEPVILVLFGDHNPLLNENSTGFEMLGVNLNLDTNDGFLNYYETPYVIWANDTAKRDLERDFIGVGNTISPNLLMNELFEYVGWSGNEYMQYLSNIRKEIDVFHPIQKKFNGKWVRELNVEQEKILEEFVNIEFFSSSNYWE